MASHPVRSGPVPKVVGYEEEEESFVREKKKSQVLHDPL
jgi:hypothetical protein